LAPSTPNKVVIESNIPIPETAYRASRYPFEDMEVGQSFLFPDGTTASNAYRYAKTANMKLDRTFIVRNTAQGRRCWRIG
jgi:hypothetical protein